MDSSTAPPPSKTTMQPTKFAKLLKVVMPMIQGGVAGMSADPRTAGGGQAAQNFFDTQAELAIRKQDLQNRTASEITQAAERKSQSDRDEAQAKRYQQLASTENDSGQWSIQDTGRGLFRVNKVTGESHPVTAEGAHTLPTSLPEGSPLVSQSDVEGSAQSPEAPNDILSRPPKQFAPPKSVSKPASQTRVISEGQQLIDTDRDSPNYGKALAKGGKKEFAPKSEKSAPAADKKISTQRTAENYADQTLKAFSGDLDKATAFVNNAKNMDPALKSQVRKLMRDASPKRKFAFTPDEDKKMGALPAGN